MRWLLPRLVPAVVLLSMLTSASRTLPFFIRAEPLARDAASLSELLSDAAAMTLASENGESVFHSNPEKKDLVALTFDDGPHPEYTSRVLDVLDRYGVRATFFVVGENASLYPELIKRELDSGHEVGNHTYSHADLSGLSYRRVCDEVIFAENVIYEQNEHLTRLLRPPGGLCSDALFKMAKRFDYEVVLWSLDTRDWALTPKEQIVRKVLDDVSSGDVILFHDYIVGESPTPGSLEIIIPELLKRGYEFVTVSELFGFE